MKSPSGSLLLYLTVLRLSGPTVSEISLQVRPNRQQFFTGESVRLSCEEEEGSAGMKLKRLSVVRTETCDAAGGFGRLNGSSCIVSDLSPLTDRGVYWCEDGIGRTSMKVTITVSARPFIMEIPALPVLTGSEVTLRCRDRRGSAIPVHFFKYGRNQIGASPDGRFTIKTVQQADEGFYWCSTNQTTSPSSRLSVRAAPPPPPPTISSSPVAPPAAPLLTLLCHLVAISPYCVSTGLMVTMYCCRRTGKRPIVTMEMAHHYGNELGLVEEHHVDDVTTEHNF